MLNHLESLCRLCGASGQEHSVRDYLIEQIKPLGLPYQVDPLGNLIVEKKGKQTPPKKWMIGAHMDEVGLIVTYINENGTMKLAPVGGIDPSVVIGRAVQVGEQRIPGVIGAKPIHLLSREDRKKAPSFSNLYLDIGAANREEAEQFVQPGTYAHFRSGYTLLGGGKLVRSKALDDRIGCAILWCKSSCLHHQPRLCIDSGNNHSSRLLFCTGRCKSLPAWKRSGCILYGSQHII